MPYWLTRTAGALDVGRPLNETALLDTGLSRCEALVTLLLMVMRETTVYTDRPVVGWWRSSNPLSDQFPRDSLFLDLEVFLARSFDSLRSRRISPAGSRCAHACKTAQV